MVSSCAAVAASRLIMRTQPNVLHCRGVSWNMMGTQTKPGSNDRLSDKCDTKQSEQSMATSHLGWHQYQGFFCISPTITLLHWWCCSSKCDMRATAACFARHLSYVRCRMTVSRPHKIPCCTCASTVQHRAINHQQAMQTTHQSRRTTQCTHAAHPYPCFAAPSSMQHAAATADSEWFRVTSSMF